MVDGTGTSTYGYDVFNELTSYETGAGNTVSYSYNADGKTTGITYPLGAGASWASTDIVGYGYDNADELNSVTDFNNNTITVGNTADGLPNSLVLGSSGDTLTTTYDPTGTPSDIKLADSTPTTLQEFAYSDEPSGAISSETDTPSGGSTYSYDAQSRVVSMTSPTASYAFDASGNLTTLPTGTSSTTYDNASELTASTLSGTTTSYSYNDDGEQTQQSIGGSTTVSAGYSGAEELTSYSNAAANMSTAGYDGDGLRQSATSTPTGGSATTEDFIWDVSGSLPRPLMDSTNAYIYGPGTTPIEQVNLSTGTIHYLVSDRLGSVRGIVSSSGALTATTSYDAWGSPQTSGGLTSYTPIGYAGAYTDPTGLLYLIARYYDPATGQFISVDPLVDQTEAPYSYVGDDPVDSADPSGLCWPSWACGAEHVAGAVAGVVTGYDTVKSFVDCTGSNSIYDCAVANFDPAYYAIAGYANEARAYENGCSLWTVAEYGAEGVVGVAATAGVAVGGVAAIDSAGYFSGREISIGDNFRISPFGNRNGNAWYERLPHYHHRILLPNGDTVPGQGIGWHRPWQKRP